VNGDQKQPAHGHGQRRAAEAEPQGERDTSPGFEEVSDGRQDGVPVRSSRSILARRPSCAVSRQAMAE
jgi:hypothetical protein